MVNLRVSKYQFNTKWYLCFAAYFFAIHLRFASFSFKTLAGDDVILLGVSNQNNGFLSTFWGSFTDHTGGKWRPISQIILSPLLDFFGGDFWKYQLLNEALLAGCGVLMAVLVFNMTGGRFLLGLSAGSFVVLARFNLYYVLQVFGLMESLAVLCMLSMLIALEKYVRLGSNRYIYFSNFFFFLTIHTHERYLFLLPVLFVCSWLYVPSKPLSARLFLVCLPLFIVAENFLVKTKILNLTFLTGGGGTEINAATTDIPTFSWRALLNIFGYNSGPDYLSGRNAHSLGIAAVFLAVGWTILLFAVILLSCIQMFRKTGWQNSCRKVCIAVLLIGPLILSASITFRQEYRWLFAPYIALIVVVHVSLNVVARSRQTLIFISCLLVSLGTLIGVYYARYAESTYFFSTQNLADSINDRLFVQYEEQMSTTTFVIVDYDSTTFNWAVGGELYNNEYSPSMNFDIRRVASTEEITALTELRENLIVFDYRWDQIVQLQGY